MTELNLSEWIERRIDHIGPHADTIIKGVQEYEDRIEELEAMEMEVWWRLYYLASHGDTEKTRDFAKEALKEMEEIENE